jgi:hypothetical protein
MEMKLMAASPEMRRVSRWVSEAAVRLEAQAETARAEAARAATAQAEVEEAEANEGLALVGAEMLSLRGAPALQACRDERKMRALSMAEPELESAAAEPTVIWTVERGGGYGDGGFKPLPPELQARLSAARSIGISTVHDPASGRRYNISPGRMVQLTDRG